MKKLIALMALLWWSNNLMAQCNDPYYNRIYPTIVERDITYGAATAYNNTNTVLQMNIWKPVGDNNTSRPIILWIHGGGFFTGNKNDMDAIAQAYAERGYVSATMSYRLGFYGNLFFSAPFTFDSSEVIRAAYRAVQDAHGAMRFLKDRSAIDSSNINLAFVGGASAGSITALHFAYVDKPSEAPPDGGAIGSVTTLFGSVPRPDLGPITGTLNINGNNSAVLAVVNLFGALLDTAFIESANDPALFSYHQTGDGTVGCNYQQGLWNQPLNVSQNYPYLFGSCAIDGHMNHLNFSTQHYQSLLYNGNTHGIHDNDLVDTLIARFLSDIICENTTGQANLQPVDLKVFPIPAQHSLTIQINQQPFTYRISDLNGRNILNASTEYHHATTVNLKGMAKGIYVLQVITGNTIIPRKIIIE
jgi:hypothetical protein